MTDKQKSLALSIAVVTCSISSSVCIAIYFLYKTAIHEETQRLTDTVTSHARLIEAVSRFSRKHYESDFPGGAFNATLQQVHDAHRQNKGFGETGEFTLATLKNGNINFLLNLRFASTLQTKSLSISSPLAEPMRMALAGKKGHLIGKDYRGEYVLAAYEPIPEMRLGLVAKIDLSEVRKPFFITVQIVGISTLFIIFGSAFTLLRFNPFIHKLDQTQKQFQATFEQAAVGIAHVGLDGKFLRVNKKICEILGYSQKELMSKTFQALTHPDDLHKDLANINRLIAGEADNYNMEKRYRLKDNSLIWANLTVAVIRDDSGTPFYFVSVIENIQERKDAIEKLKKTTKMLESSNQELDDFAYIVSHDLQEPLRGITNYSTFIIEDHADQIDDEGRAKLETIGELANRLSRLIQELLTYSRVGRHKNILKPTDLNDIFQNVIAIIQPRIEQESIEVRLKGKLPSVLCSKSQIQEVFYNLMINAIKYNDKEKKWMEVGMQDHSGTKAETVFYVRDNGIGIPQKHFDRIFTIFKRLHGRNKFGGGTGAGLAIVKKIIETHNGRIWVESVVGAGTTFYFTIGRNEE